MWTDVDNVDKLKICIKMFIKMLTIKKYKLYYMHNGTGILN